MGYIHTKHANAFFDRGCILYTQRNSKLIYILIHRESLGKLQKKVLLLMAGPLRLGEGGKGRVIKEKITFLKLLSLFCS